MSLAAGTTLGPDEIVAMIGAGGMGKVYRARDTHAIRSVASGNPHEPYKRRLADLPGGRTLLRYPREKFVKF